jgi:peptide/nickel transport system ATP-binding protein
MSAKPVVLEAQNLGVDFWVDGEWVMAAEGLNYSVRAGEVLAIVGESGSGKSASSMSLLGLLPTNGRATGTVLLSGEDTLAATPERIRAIRGREIAVIFQEPMTAMNPVYTIGFQIIEALKVHYPKPNESQQPF